MRSDGRDVEYLCHACWTRFPPAGLYACVTLFDGELFVLMRNRSPPMPRFTACSAPHLVSAR
ncbi:hypothetical protein SVEN_3370 [Streptomyces venezuelae ATCC 10712]|uniref:Uncharacterized protein n=1 Tax=Streptomyces venezuelae (strain ATCC 10712 / CBS 650.69 / DSM 40230 / JCM 4526 / NBRC 13096 / PD 04745) TaxID=953739 RepID=F2RAH4_STRVP|nr:hypothetical protein SVEN_3370 [Streptomyces venezuelae ATCC 10712]